jgi:hypothetical protein
MRRLAVALCLTAAAWALPAGSALADRGTLECVMIAGTVTVGPLADMESVTSDVSGGDLFLDVEGGGFGFTANAVCTGAGLIGPGPVPGAAVAVVPDVGNAKVTAVGTYSDIVCNTGVANGAFSVVNNPGGPPINLAGTFGMTFAGGAGRVTVRGLAGTAGAGTTYVSGDGEGVVHMMPVVGNCLTSNVPSLLMNGAFALTLS